jgi:hypothetical protein
VYGVSFSVANFFASSSETMAFLAMPELLHISQLGFCIAGLHSHNPVYHKYHSPLLIATAELDGTHL